MCRHVSLVYRKEYKHSVSGSHYETRIDDPLIQTNAPPLRDSNRCLLAIVRSRAELRDIKRISQARNWRLYIQKTFGELNRSTKALSTQSNMKSIVIAAFGAIFATTAFAADEGQIIPVFEFVVGECSGTGRTLS